MQRTIDTKTPYAGNLHVRFDDGKFAPSVPFYKAVKYMLSATVVLMGLASFAANCRWTGAALDGKWSTAGNWNGSTRPRDKNWDNVSLYGTNLVDGAIMNDMGPMKVYSLSFKGPDSLAFDSSSLITVHAPDADIALNDLVPSLAMNCDLRLDWNSTTQKATFNFAGYAELNGTLEIADDMVLSLKSSYDSGYTGTKVLDLNGPVNGPNGAIKLELAKGSRINFNDKVTVSRILPTTNYQNGTPYFNASENNIGVFEQGYGNTYLVAINAFSTNTVITWSDFYRENTGGNIYLTGNQQANRIVDENLNIASMPNSDRIRAASASTPVLMLYGTADAVAKAGIADNVSIVWNPVGDFTQEFRDRAHTTTGNLVVSNGTLKVSGSGTFNSVQKVVAAGGTFEVASTVAALTGLATLEVGDGGRFRIATSAMPLTARQADFVVSGTGVLEIPEGMLLAAKSISVDGETLPEGMYGRTGNSAGVTEVDWIEGDGLVAMSLPVPTVETVEATWDGGAEDDIASKDANWVGDAAPNLTAGGLVSTFATSGSSARFSNGGVLKGMVLDSDSDFSVTADKTLHLRQSGISTVAIPPETTRCYTLSGPVQIDCAQTWQLQDDVTLKVSGPLTHLNANETLTLAGASDSTRAQSGEIELSGSSIIAGAIDISRTLLSLRGNGVNPAEINGMGGAVSLRGDLKGSMSLSNAVIRKSLTFVGGERSRRIVVQPGSTNAIMGKITASSTPRFYISEKGVLTTGGGFIVTGGNWTVPSGTGKNCIWRISGKPLESTGVMELAGVTMSLEVPGCVYKSAYIEQNSRIAFGCDYAISNSTVKAIFTHSTAEIDLCGYNQLAGELVFENGVDGATITSATPGIYGFTQTNDLVLSALNVTGAASLAKYGAGTVTLNRAVTSTGGLIVGEGTFTFGQNGRWANSSNIVVKGTGKLVLPSSRLINKETVAVVDTAEGACIELGNNVNQRLAKLTVDGVALPSGVYGGASAPAGATRSSAFSSTGSGVVTVGHLGFSIIVY